MLKPGRTAAPNCSAAFPFCVIGCFLSPYLPIHSLLHPFPSFFSFRFFLYPIYFLLLFLCFLFLSYFSSFSSPHLYLQCPLVSSLSFSFPLAFSLFFTISTSSSSSAFSPFPTSYSYVLPGFVILLELSNKRRIDTILCCNVRIVSDEMGVSRRYILIMRVCIFLGSLQDLVRYFHVIFRILIVKIPGKT